MPAYHENEIFRIYMPPGSLALGGMKRRLLLFDAASLFQTNHVVHWNAPRKDIFFCMASWLFRTACCSFTTCLSSRGKLIRHFVTKKTHQIFLDRMLSSADELQPCLQFYEFCEWTSRNKKSHNTTQEKCPHMMYFNVPRDWFETNSQHQIHVHYSEGGKKIVAVMICWEE